MHITIHLVTKLLQLTLRNSVPNVLQENAVTLVKHKEKSTLDCCFSTVKHIKKEKIRKRRLVIPDREYGYYTAAVIYRV